MPQSKAQTKKKDECNETIKKQEEALTEATNIRDEQNKEFVADKTTDEQAIGLIEGAKAALGKFYKASLIQVAAKKTAATHTQNPVPKFLREGDNEYAGQQDEGGSVVAMLEMIRQDVQKDIDEATDEEAASLKEYQQFESDTQATIQNQNDEIAIQEGKIFDATSDKTTAETSKTQALEALSSEKDLFSQKSANCDFYMLNHETRVAQRQTELDGLRKAETILSGGA